MLTRRLAIVIVLAGALRDAPGRPDGSRAVLPDAHLCVVRPVR